jgi:hypothetical protein
MNAIPADLLTGPFLRTQALAAGASPRMLRGQRFRRLHPRVFVLRAHEMTWDDHVLAGQLVLPDRVHLTGISRIQAAGLDYGPRFPVRFVIQGDHHLAIDGVFLHRTRLLPPLDEVGVTIEAAFLFYCAHARVIDAIKVGDWLLHHGLLDLDAAKALAVAQLWRPGAHELCWVSDHLDGDSWSLKESETRPILTFAGLPAPECNVAIAPELPTSPTADLLYRQWQVAVEFEGTHHQRDREQYTYDIGRYEQYRDLDHRYVQVTNERLAKPRSLVRRVHAVLVAGGYSGPPPHFGEQWRSLFLPLSTVLGPRPVGGERRPG